MLDHAAPREDSRVDDGRDPPHRGRPTTAKMKPRLGAAFRWTRAGYMVPCELFYDLPTPAMRAWMDKS
jgi:hypothetical protein